MYKYPDNTIRKTLPDMITWTDENGVSKKTPSSKMNETEKNIAGYYSLTRKPLKREKYYDYKTKWEVIDNRFYEEIEIERTENLNEAKNDWLSKIQVEKTRIRDAGFLVSDVTLIDGTVQDVLFDSDLAARMSYQELQSELEIDTTGTYETAWKANSETWILMNSETFNLVRAAGKEHIAKCFAWQQQKSADILACGNVEEVIAIPTEYSVE